MKKFFGMLLGGCMTVSTATAAFVDGNELFSACQENDTTYLAGYVAGVTDGFDRSQSGIKQYGSNKAMSFAAKLVKPYCLPKGVRVKQLVEIICRELAMDPTNRHLAAADTIYHAASKAYPCPPRIMDLR